MRLFIVGVLAVTWNLVGAQYYGSQALPAGSYSVQQQQQQQQQNNEALRRYYYQQQLQQQKLQQQQQQQLQQQRLQQLQQQQLQQKQLQQQQLQQQRLQQQQQAAAQTAAYQQQVAAQHAAYQQQQQAAAQHAAYQQQLAAYNAAKTAATAKHSQLIASAAASPHYANYYNQNQAQAGSSSPYTHQQYQQYYQQQQQRQPSNQQSYLPVQQQSANTYQQPQNQSPPPESTPSPTTTTTAVTGEVEVEFEGVTTIATTASTSSPGQWGQESQTSISVQPSSNHGHSQPAPPAPRQHSHFQPPASQPVQGPFGTYFQPSSYQQQQQPQQQYSQSSWQSPGNGAFGGQPTPATQNLDPFSSKFEVNGLKPTIFNPQYQPPPPQAQSTPGKTSANDYSGIFGDQNALGSNPNAPAGKIDFGAKGPNPIQLNQFLAQPTPIKDANSLSANLDAILGTLLGSAAIVQPKPTTTTTTTKIPSIVTPSILVSDRLNGFVLGPKSEFRSNVFSNIPVNNIAFDNLNPLAAFMGETPPPPPTTTAAPPGRNGDFLEGFIGSHSVIQTPKPQTDYLPQNIYLYNNMNENQQVTTPAPTPAPSNEKVLNTLGTQDISAMIQKLLGVLAVKQGSGGQA